MEPIGAAYGVILNDPQLRHSLTRAAERSHRSIVRGSGSALLRRWFVRIGHKLANRDLDPRTARLSTAR
jgi:hypothetical protein